MADTNLLREEKLSKHRLRRADYYRRVRNYKKQAGDSLSIYRMEIRAMAWAGHLFIFGVTLIWATGKITIRKLWRRAWLARELAGPESSIPLVQQVLKLAPNHASANFELGLWLQEKNDSADGPRHIEAAMKSNPALQPQGQTLIADYFRRTGESERAEEIRMASFKTADAWDLAVDERQITRSSDTFLPHCLPEEAITDLVELYSGLNGISEIFLVQKKVEHFSDVPFHVIGIKPRIHPFKSWMKQREDLAFDLAMRDDQPESHVIVLLDRGKWVLHRAINQIEGSQLWHLERKWWQLR